jgi:hypothetical protein
MTPTKRIGKKKIKFEEDESHQMDVDEEKPTASHPKSSPKKKRQQIHEETTTKAESEEDTVNVTPKRPHGG